MQISYCSMAAITGRSSNVRLRGMWLHLLEKGGLLSPLEGLHEWFAHFRGLACGI